MPGYRSAAHTMAHRDTRDTRDTHIYDVTQSGSVPVLWS
jgi:hypothetical protein